MKKREVWWVFMKKALLSAVAMLAFTIVLFAGISYAWFTDSYENKGNQVSFGNFKMELEYADPYENEEVIQWYSFKRPGKADRNLFDVKVDNWGDAIQPGSKIVRLVKVKNVGDIDFAVKYQLSNVHHFASVEVVKGTHTVVTQDNYIRVNAGEEVILTITLSISESVGNEYINLQRVQVFDIKFTAEQYAKHKNTPWLFVE